MADDIDWLSVLQKVFKKYGTQLHKNQVRKFAAKVARKQGRTEDKKHLQKAFRKFLQTESGRSNVTAKDDMLSLGGALAPPQAQTVAQASAEPPAQARLSLFDLAEAAATLSTASRQTSRAPLNSKSTKGKAQAANDRVANQSAPAVPKGPRSVRKSKGESISPDAEAAGVSAVPAAALDGMQTRGLATRRPSVEKQPSSRPALPSKPKAKADKAGKAQRQLSQPSIAHTASAATQSASPARSKPEDAAQAAVPRTTDAGVSGLKQEVPSTAAPAALGQPASKSRKLLHPGKAPKVTEHTISEPGQSLSLAEGLAGGPSAAEPSAAPASQAAERKPKKHKRVRKEKDSNSSQPASHAQALAATAAGGKAVPAVGEQHSQSQQTNSIVPSAAEALAGAAAPVQAAGEPAAHGQSDTAANQPNAVKGKKKKKKRKHSEGEETQAVPASDARAPSTAAMPAVQGSLAAPMTEAVPGQAAGEAPVETASKPKKKKKQKHGEFASASRQSATPSPAPDAAAAMADADEAAMADAEDPAPSQADPGIKTKKKKKKRKHSEPADQANHSAPSASQAASAEAGPSNAAAASAATAADPSTAQREAAAVPSEPAPAVKPKKRKLKHKDVEAQQAPSSAHLNAASTTLTPADAASEPSKQIAAAVDSSIHSGEPALKVKQKRKSRALDTGTSAEAGVPSAEEAVAEAAGPAAAQQAPGTQSKAASLSDKASISSSALQSSWRENAKRQDVKKGKFTKQEKDTLKQAAIAYAQEHNLPTTDFAWLFCTRSLNTEYKGQATGAWRSISESLPHRTNKAVYACGTRMLHERNYQGKWSKEEDDQLRQLVGEKGAKWAEISRSLNRLPEGCRDRWRELKLGDAKLTGRWSEDETERLRTLVNAYMSQKQANEEQQSSGGGGLSLTLDDLESGSAQADQTKSDGRIILDDIDWDLVSEQHGTRTAAQSLTKWYTQLAPSMVTKGEWGSGDDRRLLRALLKTGAAEDFQVDWGQLVATRTAQQARRRWRLMLKCVKDANDQEFSDNLKTLVTTFTPDLLLPSPPKPVKARTSKKSKRKEVADSAADGYPGMNGGMY